MTHLKYNRSHDPIHDISLAELCRPLSARVMPASAYVNGGSRPKSPAQARMAQRGTTRQGPKSKPQALPKGGE